MNQVVNFPDGLPGFEGCRRFLLAAPDESAPFSILQSIDPPEPSFVVVDPSMVMKRYRTVLAQGDRARLGVEEDDDVVWLAIVTLDDDGSPSVNLRAPIVINPRVMTGFQVMPHQSLYPLRHPLSL